MLRKVMMMSLSKTTRAQLKAYREMPGSDPSL
jgi:hypothetical protein